VVKRLKGSDSLLSKNSLKNLKSEGKKLIGKDYDIYFGWDDEKIYCSELVWKVYNRSTGLEVGKPEKLRNFDLTNKLVKKQLQQRYGNNIPLNETVISPADIFNSNLLETIFEN
jgi:uncharacterized protein YycO